MHTFTSFAVAGAGMLGGGIVKALLERNASVLILTRPSSAPKDFPAQAKVIPIAYDDRAHIESALRAQKVQVVISTMQGGPDAYAAQEPVADAAKAAGVQLFVPSEFGMPSKGQTVGRNAYKSKAQDYLTSIELPSTRIYNGCFMEWIPFLTAFDATKTVHIIGQGDTPTTFTSIVDTASYVAHVLTTKPLAALANKELRIQGARLTLNDVAQLLSAPAKHVEAVPTEIPNSEVRTMLLRAVEAGLCSTGWNAEKAEDVEADAGSANALWEDGRWTSLQKALSL